MKLKHKLTAILGAAVFSLTTLNANATDKDIIETASSQPMFNILLSAVEASGLDNTLKGDGPYTVFAPSDEAFEALPEGTLDELLKPENKDKLKDMLNYHIVPGKYTADKMAGKMKQLETLQGSTLEINKAGRLAKVDHAAIQIPDVMATNGVVHVIDTVLTPNQ